MASSWGDGVLRCPDRTAPQWVVGTPSCEIRQTPYCLGSPAPLGAEGGCHATQVGTW